MTTPSWSVGRRAGFRFGVIVAALLMFPFPLGALAKTESIAKILFEPWHWMERWLAQSVLGLPDPPMGQTGSGDMTRDYLQLLLIAVFALAGTILWSVVDRRRKAYPRLAPVVMIVLRYYLAWVMLSYGISKILRSQFPALGLGRLEQRVGDMSPMGLVWTFMGYSGPYTRFAGLAESVGGVLLFWRRTTTIGALILIAVMTNVVLLNFCYDVPVKLFSTQLLVIAIVIASSGGRRLIAVALGHAAAEVPPRVRMSARRERARLVAKIAVLAAIAFSLYMEFSTREEWDPHDHELYGTWGVSAFVADGVELAPLTTDQDRWRKCTISGRYFGIMPMTGERKSFPMKVDEVARTITVTLDKDKDTTETLRYTRPAPDSLVIDGTHGGKYVHVTLHRDPQPLLLTRGFHWVNEVPFNR